MNPTTSAITQTFSIIAGQSKLALSNTLSHTDNHDLTTSDQNLDVSSYLYDANGILLNASGKGRTISFDGYSGHTGGELTQEYAVINGQAVVSNSVQTTWTTDSSYDDYSGRRPLRLRRAGSYDAPLPSRSTEPGRAR